MPRCKASALPQRQHLRGVWVQSPADVSLFLGEARTRTRQFQKTQNHKQEYSNLTTSINTDQNADVYSGAEITTGKTPTKQTALSAKYL